MVVEHLSYWMQPLGLQVSWGRGKTSLLFGILGQEGNLLLARWIGAGAELLPRWACLGQSAPIVAGALAGRGFVGGTVPRWSDGPPLAILNNMKFSITGPSCLAMSKM